MWIVDVVCSDPECAAEHEVVVSALDDVDRAVCECDCSYVVVAVAGFTAVYSQAA
jgi:hypothetical protein